MKQYIVDAFTDRIFSGNPAAVCVLEHWLPEQQMQNLAMENNLSETAFIVPEQDGYQLRWFTQVETLISVDTQPLQQHMYCFGLFNSRQQRFSFQRSQGISPFKSEQIAMR